MLYADVPAGGTLAGLGPVGQMAVRIARHLGVERVIGMEAHGHNEPRSTRLIAAGQKPTGLLPDSLAAKVSDRAAQHRLGALHTAVKAVRRGGTVSVLPLQDAPHGYEIFRDKAKGCIKVVLQP